MTISFHSPKLVPEKTGLTNGQVKNTISSVIHRIGYKYIEQIILEEVPWTGLAR